MDKEDELHEKTKDKIKYTTSKARINEKEVYQLVKEFFMELLELDYEFTHEELIQEMKKTYIDRENLDAIVTFLERIGEMEFTGKKFTQKELRGMLEDLHHVIDMFVHDKEKPGFWKRMRRKLSRKKEIVDTTSLEMLDNKVQEEVNRVSEALTDRQEDILMQIHSYIEQIKEEEDKHQKKELYKLAMEQYNHLPDDQQSKVYDELFLLFKEIEKAYTISSSE